MPLIAKQKRFGQSNEWNLIVKRSLDGSAEQELISLDIVQENKKGSLSSEPILYSRQALKQPYWNGTAALRSYGSHLNEIFSPSSSSAAAFVRIVLFSFGIRIHETRYDFPKDDFKKWRSGATPGGEMKLPTLRCFLEETWISPKAWLLWS